MENGKMQDLNILLLVIEDVLIFLTVLVALFGERCWKRIDSKRREVVITKTLKGSLLDFQTILVRIRDNRNSGKANLNDQIIFDTTSFSEIQTQDFLFKKLFLKNEDVDFSKYPNVFNFFNNYLINRETLENRRAEGSCALTRATVDRLLDFLKGAIEELNQGHSVEVPLIKKSNMKITSDFCMVLLTAVIAFTGFQQYQLTKAQQKVSYELAGIAKTQEAARIREAKKELRDISRKIVLMFPMGIKNHMSTDIANNIKIMRSFNDLLNQGYGNYYLAQNENNSQRWMEAIKSLEFYILGENVQIEVTDDQSRKAFSENMITDVEKAWKKIVEVYLDLGLNFKGLN